MRHRPILALLCLTALRAQTPEQTLGTSATLNYTVPADEAAFDVEISAPQLLDSARVAAAFADFAVKQDNIVRISSASNSGFSFAGVLLPNPVSPPAAITWLVQFSVPAARLRETSDKLDSLSRRLPEPFTGITYSGGLTYSRAALDTATASAIARMVEDSRRTLQPLAQAAGLSTTPIASLIETTRGALDFSFATFLRSPSTSVITSASVRFGRLPERFLTTNCSDEVSLPPDEALFRVQIQAPVTTPRSQVIDAISRFGVTTRDLIDQAWSLPASLSGPIVTPAPILPSYTYTFEFRQPALSAQETFTRLADLRRAPPEGVSSVIYGIGMNSSDRARDAISAKAASTVIVLCRARAERIAAAVQTKLGPVRGVAPFPVLSAPFAIRLGDPAQALQVESSLRAPFSASVTFALE